MDVHVAEQQLPAVKANCQGQADYSSPAGGDGPVQPPNSKLYHAKATTNPGRESPGPARASCWPRSLPLARFRPPGRPLPSNAIQHVLTLTLPLVPQA